MSKTPRTDQAARLAVATLQISGLPGEALKEVVDESRKLELELAAKDALLHRLNSLDDVPEHLKVEIRRALGES